MTSETIEQHPPADEEQPKAPLPAPPEPLSPDMAAAWRQTTQPVFVVEDSFYRSRTPPRPVHWSIAWSDLMMTMFILFLTLFAHLRTHQEIRAHGQPNRIADETIPVHTDSAKSSLIFHPISQAVSHKTGDQLQETALPKREQPGADILIRNRMVEEHRQPEPLTPIPEVAPKPPTPPVADQARHEVQPPEPAAASEAKTPREEVITKIYDLSKVALAEEKLERFASVEMVPDKTMRIILTGDLLFSSGQAELTPGATDSLKKLAAVVKKTPYMINVIGHTDDRPVKTSRFPTNWELSLARAGRVARFLIDETKLPATQFSVSGYSSFRPVHPNTNEANRKTNRRVEIVLSKELPQATVAAPANFQ